jgi:hypothetical protein
VPFFFDVYLLLKIVFNIVPPCISFVLQAAVQIKVLMLGIKEVYHYINTLYVKLIGTGDYAALYPLVILLSFAHSFKFLSEK